MDFLAALKLLEISFLLKKKMIEVYKYQWKIISSIAVFCYQLL